MAIQDENPKRLKKLLRFLSSGACRLIQTEAKQKLRVLRGEKHLSVDVDLLNALVRKGLVQIDDTNVTLTRDGRMHLRRLIASEDPFREQHNPVTEKMVEIDGLKQVVKSNENESPLARLYHRKDKTGSSFLSEAEFLAGEKLRADFTRGHLMQRVTANWQASVASTGRDASRNGIEDLTDAALSGRSCVENAIETVGPELSGVLIDICCFLKSISQVERERRWPSRSAKLMLKTALSILARHYGLTNTVTGKRSGKIAFWGAIDYRPEITSPRT